MNQKSKTFSVRIENNIKNKIQAKAKKCGLKDATYIRCYIEACVKECGLIDFTNEHVIKSQRSSK